jgi:hypothetical protein
MMFVTKGSTDVSSYFHLRLTADGTDATGLTITDFDLQYTRAGATPAAKVDATALGAANSAHGDNQAIEVDPTDQPGLYRVDWPDAAFATGVDEVFLTVKVATAFTETLRVRLTSATRGLAGTALPDAAADAAGGLPISDAGGLDLDAQVGTKINDILTDTGTTLDGRIPAALVGGRMDANVGAISGDATAADNLESYTDGSEFMPVDAHQQDFSVSGTSLTTKKPDGTTDTAYSPKTLTTDPAAEPITGAS